MKFFGTDDSYDYGTALALQDLKDQIKKLENDQKQLLDCLVELVVAIRPISNASISNSPLGKAGILLEKHRRYWK